MDGSLYLIVNADDLGHSAGVNEGIVEAHERGVVTSASLMVKRPAATAAVDATRGLASLAIGLHLEIAEWVYENGEWRLAQGRHDTDDREAVDAECRRQVAAFRSLLGR